MMAWLELQNNLLGIPGGIRGGHGCVFVDFAARGVATEQKVGKKLAKSKQRVSKKSAKSELRLSKIVHKVSEK